MLSPHRSKMMSRFLGKVNDFPAVSKKSIIFLFRFIHFLLLFKSAFKA